jgi:hypothetical protein
MRVAAVTFLLCFVSLSCYGADPKVEIESLLTYVSSLEGASFLRNGKVYTGKEAAKHLRWKWEKAGDRVKTAEDFIKDCATQQYLTGRKYTIKFQDGTEKPCGDVLTEKLKDLRAET